MYKGSATGGMAGMDSHTFQSIDGATTTVTVDVTPALTIWGEGRAEFHRWSPAVAQISITDAKGEYVAAFIAEVDDAVQGKTSGLRANSYYSPAMTQVTFVVGTAPLSQDAIAGGAHTYCRALANIFRFTDGAEVTQTEPPPPPPVDLTDF